MVDMHHRRRAVGERDQPRLARIDPISGRKRMRRRRPGDELGRLCVEAAGGGGPGELGVAGNRRREDAGAPSLGDFQGLLEDFLGHFAFLA